MNFYYQNVYRGFLQSNSYFISYLGLDTNASLKSQTVNATAASMMGVEEGPPGMIISWTTLSSR